MIYQIGGNPLQIGIPDSYSFSAVKMFCFFHGNSTFRTSFFKTGHTSFMGYPCTTVKAYTFTNRAYFSSPFSDSTALLLHFCLLTAKNSWWCIFMGSLNYFNSCFFLHSCDYIILSWTELHHACSNVKNINVFFKSCQLHL